MEFDTTYLRRSENLVKDAKKKAYSTKTGVALKGYKADGALKRLGIVGVGSVGISAAATAAGAAAIGAGVAASAVTFGIAPAVGIALTYVLAKGGAEASYQGRSKELKKGMDNDDFAIHDPSLLVPAIAKVLKKWTRVHRRATQLKGGLRGRATKVRHGRTSLRAAMKNTRLGRRIVKSETSMFSPTGVASTDHELSDRLYELRFYSQILFNYLREVIDSVAVAERDGVADMCELVYGHVVRQVHVSGSHSGCENCYGMSGSEFRRRMADFEAEARAAARSTLATRERSIKPGARGFRQETQASFEIDEQRLQAHVAAKAVGRVKADNLAMSMQMIQGEARDAELKMAKTFNDGLTKWGFRAAQASKVAVPVGKEIAGKTAKVASNAGTALSQAAPTTFAGAGAGLVFAEFALTVKNRLTRRSVLKRKGKAFDLTQEGEQARAEAIRNFEDLLTSTDITKRGERVASKCSSYVTKLNNIKETMQPQFEKLVAAGASNSGLFSSCDDAHDFAYAMNYYFRNSEKFIAFLVYLEAILIDIDLKVVHLDVGTHVGDIVDVSENARMPRKPKTVK